MQSSQPLKLSDRLEIAAARTIAALPRSAKRRIAGQPIRRDGLELDLDMQVLVKLDERDPRPPLAGGTPAEARTSLSHAVRVLAGPQIPVASVQDRKSTRLNSSHSQISY